MFDPIQIIKSNLDSKTKYKGRSITPSAGPSAASRSTQRPHIVLSRSTKSVKLYPFSILLTNVSTKPIIRHPHTFTRPQPCHATAKNHPPRRRPRHNPNRRPAQLHLLRLDAAVVFTSTPSSAGHTECRPWRLRQCRR